jgi:hypothetical protein
MGSSRRSWFPLAALGFAQLVLVALALVPAAEPGPRASPLTQDLSGLGTGGVGGTERASAVAIAVAVKVVPSARLGWLAGLACVVLAVAGWYWLSLRHADPPPRPVRFVLGTLGALAALPLLDLAAALELPLSGDVRGGLLAALGLVVLAAFERSRLVLAVAGVSALVTVLIPAAEAGALVSAAVLFAAAFAVLLRRPHDTAADTA